MLKIALFLILVGVVTLLGGNYDRWLFREGKDAPRDTISGGGYLAGVWNRRIGFVLLIAGVPILMIAIVWEIVT